MDAMFGNPLFPVFACIAICSSVASVGYYWHKVRQDAIEADLKREMLQRGMSADDIVTVLTGKRSKSPSRDVPPEKPVAKSASPARGV